MPGSSNFLCKGPSSLVCYEVSLLANAHFITWVNPFLLVEVLPDVTESAPQTAYTWQRVCALQLDLSFETQPHFSMRCL